MARDHDNHIPRPQPRYRKRVLAVQAMAGETAWLDGHLRWQEGRVVWQTEHNTRAPAPADLALATRRLNQIARYRIAAGHALDHPAAWLARRRAHLALAKALHTLRAPDLPALCDRARAGDAAALRRLVPLLAPEVLCLDGLPAAPSAALLAAGAGAIGPLRAGIEDEAAPPAGRALAALVLGALRHRQVEEGDPPPPAAVRAVEWLQRAYAWGRRAGLPGEPALVVTLLALPDGPALAARYEAVARDPGPFALPVPALRELLANGAPAGRVVHLVEALAAARALADRILQYRDELPEGPRERRRAAAYVLQQQRQYMVETLHPIVHGYAQAADPGIIEELTRVVHAVLDRIPVTPAPLETLLDELRAGLALPPDLQRPYLELWGSVVLHAPSVASWLEERDDSGQGWPVLAALRATSDPALVREAMEMDVVEALGRYTWPDRERYRWLLAATRALGDAGGYFNAWPWCHLLNRLKDASGSALLQPLLDALLTGPPRLRKDVLVGIEDATPNTYQDLRATLSHLIPHVPALLRFAAANNLCEWHISELVPGILALDRAVHAAAPRWLEWLLADLEAHMDEAHRVRDLTVDMAVPLAVTLAEGDLASFQAIIHAAYRQTFSYSWASLENGFAVLPRHPALRALLTRSFPHQPQRSIDLLERVSLTRRFDPANLVPLATLDPAFTGEPAPAPPDWQPLLDLAPDLAPLAAAYCHARRLVAASDEMPAGVRRALDQPAKWAAELVFLERRVAQEPGRADLATRAANLRARLADPATRAAIAEEAGERLEQIAAEAGLTAAEHQVRACYRARLAGLVTPLPADLVMDDDWLNATLLLGDISQNRRLLLRLVRACLAGNRAWPAQHPTNQAFLQDLAQYGVDTAAWLDTWPRSYRCPGVPGGRVRLHLERDPLHILQMGNYFDTCLSFGGGNSFSTVANACELNKRVIYAVDGAGRVVGRKLIGLDADTRLIGFRTYTALRDKAGNAALRSIFRRYCAAFAARCGLAQADEGTVPRLFAEAWYDDGSVPWNDEEPPPRPSSNPTRPAGPKHAPAD